MSGVAEAWLRWRLSEEREGAREWADRLVSKLPVEQRQVLERVGRRLYGLSAALTPGAGERNIEEKLRQVWKLLEGQQQRARKHERTKDEAALWQEIHEQMKGLDETATALLDGLVNDVIAAEPSESPETLHLTLIELYINVLLAHLQILRASPQTEGKSP